VNNVRARLLFLSIVTSLAACDGAQKTVGAQPEKALPAAFVGSASCTACHSQQAADWRGSHHDLAMQLVDDSNVLGDFSDTTFDYFGGETRFYRRDDGYFVKTADSGGQPAEFRVKYTFGVEPLQQYLVELPRGHVQALPFAWDSRPQAQGGQRWFHLYPQENIQPGDPLFWTGREQNWNYMCAECHSTQVDLGYSAKDDSFDTSYAEINVGCEACHGPGSRHIARIEREASGADSDFPANLDDRMGAVWQMDPVSGIARRSEVRPHPPRQPESCGRCHSRRGVLAPEYAFGRPLADTHLPALLDEPLYFADGQIHGEVFVYGSFLQSRMYQAGVSCSDCHNPHSLKLVTGDNPDDVCAQCHSPAIFARQEHQRHGEADVGCVDCHMAARTYMVVDDRRDHSFRVPRPDLTKSTGTPNACNGCHTDQDADWASAAMLRWYGTTVFDRPEFATALAAARRGHANAQLREVVNGPVHAGIARATALSLLSHPMSSDDYKVLGASLADPDPLLRIAAQRVLRRLPAELRLRLGTAGLRDSARGVRIEAAMTLAGHGDRLNAEDAAHFNRAADEHRAAYSSIANRPEALTQLGDFALADGRVEQALAHYRASLAMAPAGAATRANLADLYRRSGREDEAEKLLREGTVIDGSNAALRHALGLLLIRTGRQAAGLEELRAAQRLNPENRRFVYVLGIALNSTGQQEAAVALLESAHREFPADFDIAWALATIYRDRGELTEALSMSAGLLRRHPGNPEVLALQESLTTGTSAQ
jgi:tetratricopeptide (TPR) repeat protein